MSPPGARSRGTSWSNRPRTPGCSGSSSGRWPDMTDVQANPADLLDLQALIREQVAGANPPKRNGLTIIAWSGDLDRIWPTLILSTTAAASGMQATVFFTFWGLFQLVKPEVRITGDHWMQKML